MGFIGQRSDGLEPTLSMKRFTVYHRPYNKHQLENDYHSMVNDYHIYGSAQYLRQAILQEMHNSRANRYHHIFTNKLTDDYFCSPILTRTGACSSCFHFIWQISCRYF